MTAIPPPQPAGTPPPTGNHGLPAPGNPATNGFGHAPLPGPPGPPNQTPPTRWDLAPGAVKGASVAFGVYGLLLIVGSILQFTDVSGVENASDDFATTVWALGAVAAFFAIFLGLGMLAMAVFVVTRMSRSTRIAASLVPLTPAVLGIGTPYIGIAFVGLSAVFTLIVIIALWCSPAVDSAVAHQRF
ncbi:hypothetical protein C6V83_00250 [Gordonia iterans]|uniref:Uncharacterized protein n=1 Tax=Gordonia iterans TaxID=1004901 RepID=A0A2S0KBA8_9ACTN|nr:hypothetical protein [Gordonia iterans]AVL98945.1 hypothetical protein C6V83_00250 [Gordonia iterans]